MNFNYICKLLIFNWLKAYFEGLKERLKIFGYLFQQNQACGNPLVQPDSALNTFKISIYGFYRQQRPCQGLPAFSERVARSAKETQRQTAYRAGGLLRHVFKVNYKDEILEIKGQKVFYRRGESVLSKGSRQRIFRSQPQHDVYR